MKLPCSPQLAIGLAVVGLEDTMRVLVMREVVFREVGDRLENGLVETLDSLERDVLDAVVTSVLSLDVMLGFTSELATGELGNARTEEELPSAADVSEDLMETRSDEIVDEIRSEVREAAAPVSIDSREALGCVVPEDSVFSPDDTVLRENEERSAAALEVWTISVVNPFVGLV